MAIEPSTGKILAMVSVPTFDPNRLATHDFAAARQALQAARRGRHRAAAQPGHPEAAGPRLDVQARHRRGRARVGQVRRTRRDRARAATPSSCRRPPAPPAWSTTRAATARADGLTLRQAMEQSCNTTFAQLAIEVGSEGMLRQAEKFGFNSDYLDDLGGQVALGVPRRPHPARGRPDRHRPVRGAGDPAADGDGGRRDRQRRRRRCGPTSSTRCSRPTTTPRRPSPRSCPAAISEETAPPSPTCSSRPSTRAPPPRPQIEDVAVAGKTGTAQRGVPGKPPYGWFVSFAPAGDADVAVAVMIEEAPGQEIAGGRLGGPIAKAVMEAVLDK